MSADHQHRAATTIYRGRTASLATMHQRQRAIAWPLKRALGLALAVPSEIDTDQFGTFSSEVPRPGSPLETVLKKARLGMDMTG